MKALKVYIGVVNGQFPPSRYDTSWIPIFCPVDAYNNNIDNFILPTAFDPKNANAFKIDSTTMQRWTSRYEEKMPILDTTNQAENRNPGNRRGRNKKSDTRYVTYCPGDLRYMVQIIDLFQRRKNPISNNMKCVLASYGKKGNSAEKFKDRTLIQFVLLDNGNKEFYLDTLIEKWKDGATKCDKLLPGDNKIIDNGQLCPNNCLGE